MFGCSGFGRFNCSCSIITGDCQLVVEEFWVLIRALIPLTNSKEFAIVDGADWPSVFRHTWYLKRSAWCSYVSRCFKRDRRVVTMRLHTFIMQPPKNFDVHHVEGNVLDNRRSKLEIIEHKKHGYIKVDKNTYA